MLEAIPEPGAIDLLPRASLILPPGAAGNQAAIWMGGARALRGEEVHASALGGSWIVDAAGDMPGGHAAAAARVVHCVFADLEETPPNLARIREIVQELAAARAHRAGPKGLYIVCAQGLNRSGLLTGLLLRSFGLTGEDALTRIREARPGALANHAFERLVRTGS